MKTVQESDEATRQLAYKLWEEGGRMTHSADGYWFQAEKELSGSTEKPENLMTAVAQDDPKTGKNLVNNGKSSKPHSQASERPAMLANTA